MVKTKKPTKKEIEEFHRRIEEISKQNKEHTKKIFSSEDRKRMLDAMLKGAKRAKEEMRVAYKELEKKLYVCPKCDYHFRINSQEYIKILLDKKSFKEFGENIKSADPLKFKDSKKDL